MKNMRTKKLKLEKLQITKLKSVQTIFGGGGGATATDDRQKASTLVCNPKEKK